MHGFTNDVSWLYARKQFSRVPEYVATFALLVTLCGCATVDKAPPMHETSYTKTEQREAQEVSLQPATKSLKHKIAIGRFSNETRYGKALLTADDIDPLGRQTSDMLARRLVESQQFLVLERPDVGLVEMEQMRQGSGNTVGADTLIVGSLTEFGRSTTGKRGFVSQTKEQLAYAKVEVRLIDVRTGHAFHSASGAAEATIEQGQVAGFGNQAGYDATLNDKAIGAAISDLMSDIVSQLSARPWRTDILQVNGDVIMITGGSHQGIKVGDEFVVKKAGERVVSAQSGFEIELPGNVIARIRIESQFGDSETNEGSVGRIIEGSVAGLDRTTLYVSEK